MNMVPTRLLEYTLEQHLIVFHAFIFLIIGGTHWQIST